MGADQGLAGGEEEPQVGQLASSTPNGGEGNWGLGRQGEGLWEVGGAIGAPTGLVGRHSAHHSDRSFWLFWLFQSLGLYIYIDGLLHFYLAALLIIEVSSQIGCSCHSPHHSLPLTLKLLPSKHLSLHESILLVCWLFVFLIKV